MLLLILAVNVVALAVGVVPVCVQMAREHRAYAAGRALASGYAAGLGPPATPPTARSVRARGLLVIQRSGNRGRSHVRRWALVVHQEPRRAAQRGSLDLGRGPTRIGTSQRRTARQPVTAGQ